MARQPYKGFTKLYGALSIGDIEATDPNRFNAYGMTFEQITPYLYKSTDDYNMSLHVSMSGGKVEKISMPTSDILPVSQSTKIFNIFSIIAGIIQHKSIFSYVFFKLFLNWFFKLFFFLLSFINSR